MDGAQQQVVLYERDLCLTAALCRAAAAAAKLGGAARKKQQRAAVAAAKGKDNTKGGPCVLAIVGLAHVPGIVGNW